MDDKELFQQATDIGGYLIAHRMEGMVDTLQLMIDRIVELKGRLEAPRTPGPGTAAMLELARDAVADADRNGWNKSCSPFWTIETPVARAFIAEHEAALEPRTGEDG